MFQYIHWKNFDEFIIIFTMHCVCFCEKVISLNHRIFFREFREFNLLFRRKIIPRKKNKFAKNLCCEILKIFQFAENLLKFFLTFGTFFHVKIFLKNQVFKIPIYDGYTLKTPNNKYVVTE